MMMWTLSDIFGRAVSPGSHVGNWQQIDGDES